LEPTKSHGKKKESNILWQHLDPCSKTILDELNFKLLAKFPKESKLFDGQLPLVEPVKETRVKMEVKDNAESVYQESIHGQSHANDCQNGLNLCKGRIEPPIITE
jgi:hypothetical protein